MKQKKVSKKQEKDSAISLNKTGIKVPVIQTEINSFIERYALFITVLLSLLISLVVFYDYIFKQKVFLFKDIGSDSINVFLPVWDLMANTMRMDGIPKWTFNWGMGQNIYPMGLSDPFEWIIAIIGAKDIPNAIVYLEILKILLAAVFFYLYSATMKISKYAAIIGSLLFAFSGFMILGASGWYIHSREVYLTAFFLFSIERYLQRNQWYFIPIMFYFIGGGFMYMYLAFFILYFVVRFIDLYSIDIKLMLRKGIILTCFAFLGVLMATVPAIASIMNIYNSPRVSGGVSSFNELMSKPMFGLADSVEYISILMRSFSNDLIGTGNSFRGWHNYLEAPVGYIGLLTLLLFPLFFQIPDKKRKIIFGILTAFVFLALIFPYFRYAFWGFGVDYFRTYSFFIAFFLLFLAIQAFEFITSSTKVNWMILAISLLVCLIILYADYGNKELIINKSLRSVITVYMIIYAGLIFLLRFPLIQGIVKLCIIIFICTELIYLSKQTVNNRDVMTKKEVKGRVGYNDYTVDAINYLDSLDKGFFRITKYYGSGLAMHRSINDALVQNYKGTVSYSSFNQKYYMEFLKGTGAIKSNDADAAKWSPGVSNRPFLQNLVGCKYTLTKTDMPVLDVNSYEPLTTFSNVRVYRDKHYLPLGLAYDSVILASDYSKLPPFQKDISLFKGFVIDDLDSSKFSGFPRVQIFDTIALGTFGFNLYDSLIQNRRRDTLIITSFSNNLIKGNINISKKQLLFLSIPYDAGWKIKVNNSQRDLLVVNFGLMGVNLDEGFNEIELEFEPILMKESAGLSALGFVIYIVLLTISLVKNKKSKLAINAKLN